MSIPRTTTHWISDPALLKADGVDMRWSVSRLRKAASNFVGLFGYENCGVFWFEISDQVQLFFALGLADSNCAVHTRFCNAEKLPLFRNVFSFQKICLGKKWEWWTQQMISCLVSLLCLPVRILCFQLQVPRGLGPNFWTNQRDVRTAQNASFT